jgi:NAD(P)-dependent dehydrogenase (short-subunit alcohol dehydrogenase family)
MWCSVNTRKSSQCVWVIGASGGIGSAVVSRWLQESGTRVIAISATPYGNAEDCDPSGLTRVECDYTSEAIERTAGELVAEGLLPDYVVLAGGILHDGDSIAPERQLEQLGRAAMHAVFDANVVVPSLWLAALAKPLRQSSRCVVAVLSARVGSIGDNSLGGWYSYRASKAALNMVLRSAAVELKRRAKGVKLIAFHPGTTDTALSKPFQRNVRPGKLFSPDYVANCLVELMQSAPIDAELSFVDYAGKSIPW